jgi:hypothetical protein
VAFDTLSYARRLKQAGVPDAQAEAMADATRELVVSDFASKGDTAGLKEDIAALRSELKGDIAAVRAEIVVLEQRIMAAMDNLGLRLTVRLGGLIAVGVAVLAAVIKL